jgi:hypothetical protein
MKEESRTMEDFMVHGGAERVLRGGGGLSAGTHGTPPGGTVPGHPGFACGHNFWENTVVLRGKGEERSGSVILRPDPWPKNLG